MLQWIPAPQAVQYTESEFYPKKALHAVLTSPCGDERLRAQVRVLFPEVPLVEEQGVLYRLSVDYPQQPVCAEKEQWKQCDGYLLAVSETGILIQASSASGLFYGMQTLAQAMRQKEQLPGMLIEDYPDFLVRSAHYDLRQTHPAFEQLLAYIPVLASYKYNMLMIEYEDKFPFQRHTNLCNADYCLTQQQVKQLQQEAERNFIEVLPLQQTFGHLEYVLQHHEYQHLRVTQQHAGELCPCHEDAYTLTCELLDEVAAQHPNSRYLHLGCDEVWSLGQCPNCKGKVSRETQFITFVNRLAAHVVSLGKTPMLWHDMLMKCTDEELALLDKRCAVVIWTYLPTGADEIVREFAPRLKALGIQAFVAPAARCFDWKEIQNYPVIENRMKNIDSMVQSAAECHIEGIIVTNWAAAFSLGCPYGVYETTWYPMLYAAQAVWNRNAEKDDFLTRFFCVFHGAELPKSIKTREKADYIQAVTQYEAEMPNNGDAVSLFRMMLAYEAAVFELRVLYRYLYRLEVFPNNPLELRCVQTRYEPAYARLKSLRRPFAQEIEKYLPAHMAQQFVCSRFYLADHMQKTVYTTLPDIQEN